MPQDAADQYFMRAALSMARRGLGNVAPNPAVGCVIVKDGHIIARAHTAPGGRPHAETQALQKVDAEAKGATAYVSLEPCAHHGQTAPCAQALIEAGIARAVIAYTDPDPRVSGKGIEMFEKASIEVTTGVLEKQAQELNRGFILKVTQNRPLVTLKIATSSDHKIALKGQRTKISGELAGRYMHLERSMHDAILIGSETALIDKPKLTTRIEGIHHDSLRVILDGSGRIQSEDFYVLTNESLDTRDIKAVLAHLAEKGITRLLVEGGAQIHESFLNAELVDRFLWCKSSQEIGPQGVEALNNLDITRIEEISGLKHTKTRMLGEDTLEIYERPL
ncbi:MAG: bifunctional diaminohydroxyphosphoribosylaminopyrimidine deaminase/5-amino-6-(5-phosphoribosylamino)uracil reductase RibD [Alphaproteobacteria bacterium]|nr:bifunctional diaminohydroxyphosphoribosylaminopyrimidine deaminase/5-amino-6-(5-phosphoribosylamino)uracil reductase RibD [Alphaproteobacteria bacterium]